MKEKQPKPVNAWGFLSCSGNHLMSFAHIWNDGSKPTEDAVPVIIHTLADDRERSRRIKELEKENDELKQSLAVFQRCR